MTGTVAWSRVKPSLLRAPVPSAGTPEITRAVLVPPWESSRRAARRKAAQQLGVWLYTCPVCGSPERARRSGKLYVHPDWRERRFVNCAGSEARVVRGDAT